MVRTGREVQGCKVQRQRIGFVRTVRTPQVGRNRRWQLNLFDPDGSRTELMEPYTMR